MPTLRSGAVIVGAYAIKIRRSLFAQLKDKIRSKEIDTKEIARASGEINRMLYLLFVEKLRMDKGDVVRISIDYEITPENSIVWKYETLKVEAYRKVPEDEISRYIEEIRKNLEKMSELKTEEYEIIKLRETKLGDVIFDVKKSGKTVGIILATQIDQEIIVRGAIKEPPLIISKSRLEIKENLENTVVKSFSELLRRAVSASENEVEKIINEIKEL
ncbi:MAG: DUF2258 domain-containing protein [Candidatus Aenigmatarchaeota archaeon]